MTHDTSAAAAPLSSQAMKITYCCTGTNPEPWLQGLRAAFPQADIYVWEPGAPQADYAVVWAPPQQFIDEQPRLKALFNTGAGVDALMKLRIPAHTQVVRLHDAGMSVQMSEYVAQAVIRHFRELPLYESQMQQGLWKVRKPTMRAEFPVGVMGLGVLGERVAKTLAMFEFPVRGWSRSPKTLDGVTTYSGDAGFREFLAQTRVLVNLLPLTPDTADILNRQTMAQLQAGAYVINVARGGHLVEEDLLALIAEGHVAGATLDVFRQEPLPADHPLRHEPRITLTPHISARTLRDETIAQIVAKVAAISQGERVPGMVDPQRGY